MEQLQHNYCELNTTDKLDYLKEFSSNSVRQLLGDIHRARALISSVVENEEPWTSDCSHHTVSECFEQVVEFAKNLVVKLPFCTHFNSVSLVT